MANSTAGIFGILPAALDRASESPTFTKAFMESIYLDYRPCVGAVGQTIEILIPTVNTNDVNFIGAGPVVRSDATHGAVSLSITQKANVTFALPNFTSVQSEIDLADLYLKPKTEALLRGMNNDFITSTITQTPSATNFAANTVVAGSGGHPTRSDISKAVGELFNQGCPVDDGQLYLTMSGTPYYAMTADQNFSFQYIAGTEAGADAQQHAVLETISGAKVLKDQQFPVNGSTGYYGVLAHKYAHAARFLVEKPDNNQVAFEKVIMPIRGVPVRVEAWYDPYQQATLCSMSVVYGVTVARDAYRVLMTF